MLGGREGREQGKGGGDGEREEPAGREPSMEGGREQSQDGRLREGRGGGGKGASEQG